MKKHNSFSEPEKKKFGYADYCKCGGTFFKPEDFERLMSANMAPGSAEKKIAYGIVDKMNKQTGGAPFPDGLIVETAARCLRLIALDAEKEGLLFTTDHLAKIEQRLYREAHSLLGIKPPYGFKMAPDEINLPRRKRTRPRMEVAESPSSLSPENSRPRIKKTLQGEIPKKPNFPSPNIDFSPPGN